MRAKFEVIKKKGKLKTMSGWYFMHMPKHAQWGDRFEFWRAGSHHQCNHPHLIFCQSVRGFLSSDPPKIWVSPSVGWSLLQQCKHCRGYYTVIYLVCIVFLIAVWKNSASCIAVYTKWSVILISSSHTYIHICGVRPPASAKVQWNIQCRNHSVHCYFNYSL